MTKRASRVEAFLDEVVGPFLPGFSVVSGLAVAAAKVVLGVLAVPLIPLVVVLWFLIRVLAMLHNLGDRTWAAASHFVKPGNET